MATNTTATVSKKTRTITMDTTKTITYPTAGTLTFSYDGEDETATVSSLNTGVATVAMLDSNLGGTLTITPVAVGTADIIVHVPETTNYKEASKTCKVTVGNGTLSGSCNKLNLVLRNAIYNAHIDMVTAFNAVTINPMRLLGIKNKGLIERGYDADIAIFDDDFNTKELFKL